MNELSDFIRQHTVRGECQCGRCIDRGDRPDPEGHTADLIFFKVAAVDSPTRAEFLALTRGQLEHILDGREHSYKEIGYQLGDQGLALQYMGLGSLLGVLTLLTPKTVLTTISDEQALQLAGAGLVTVCATPATPE